MTDVFISYSRKDSEFVRSLYARLDEEDRNAWVDWDNIPLTADWLEEIKAGIEAADSFIYVISPDSVHSDVCAAELGHALENKKRLIPIVRRELIEPYDQAALHPTISSHNWLFFREDDDFDSAFKSLMNALDSDLDHMRIHTRLLVKSKEWRDRDRDASLLLRGNDLQEAATWLTNAGTKKPEPTDMHTEFIMTSRNLSHSRQRTTLVWVTAGLVFSIGLTVLSFFLYQDANVQRGLADDALIVADRRAELASSLALSSIAKQVPDSTLALALAQEAADIVDPPSEVVRSLADVVYAPGVRNIFESHTDHVNTVAFSSERHLFASGGRDTTVMIWEANNTTPRAVLGVSGNEDDEDIGHTAAVNAIAFSPDDTLLASADANGRVIVWRVETIEKVADFTIGDVGINDVAWDHLGGRLVLASDDGVITIWDVREDEEISSYIEVEDIYFRDEAVTAVDVDGLGRRVVAGYENGYVAEFFLFNGQLRFDNAFEAHTDVVTDIEYSPSNDHFVTASEDEFARIWNVADGTMHPELIGHTNQIQSVAYSADGNYLVTTSNDRTLIYWNAHTGQALNRFWGHDNWVLSSAFTPDGRGVISGSRDSNIILWDLIPGNVISQQPAHNDWIRATDISSDGTMAVSASDDGFIKLWQLPDMTQLRTLRGHNADVRGIAFTPDNSQLLSGSLDSTVRLWDIESGSFTEITFEGMEGVQSVAVSPDGNTALASNDNGLVYYFSLPDGELIHAMEGHIEASIAVAFSPDGTQAVSGSDDHNVILWDLESGDSLRVLSGHTRESLSVDFSPDGNHAISGSRDTNIIYWDLETGEGTTLAGHGSSVRGIAISPDGKTALSASADLTIFMWDLETGEILREMGAHNRTVYDVEYTPDGQNAFSVSRDTTVIFWRVDDIDTLLDWATNNRYNRALAEEECQVYNVECETEE